MDWKKNVLFLCMHFILLQAYPQDPVTSRVINFLKTSSILQAIRNIHQSNGDNKDEMIVLEVVPYKKKSDFGLRSIDEKENIASELLEKTSPFGIKNGRRSKKEHTRHKFRDRSKFYYGSDSEHTSSQPESTEGSSSSSYEKNPGNPYSVHKDKYYQNYLWNHAMTGDHMNINPTAPKFQSHGPSGADLFFGRKWWYFNQDDYMPLK